MQILQEKGFLPALERAVDKAKGMLWGMFTGDSLGVFYEFSLINYRKITQETASKLIHRGEGGSRKEFNLKPGIWSDDASQGACLLQALRYMHENRLDAFPQAYFLDLCTQWFFEGLNSGLGPECQFASVGVGSTVFPMLTAWQRISRMQITVKLDLHVKTYLQTLPNLPDIIRLQLPDIEKDDMNLHLNDQALFFLLTRLNQLKNLSESLQTFCKDLENASTALQAMKEAARGNTQGFSYQVIAASEGAEKYGIKASIKRANGNGSIMRIAGCALDFAMDNSLSHEEKLLKVMERAYYQSLATTPGRLSSDASRMLTFLLYQALHSPIKDPKALIAWLLGEENIALFMRLANTQVLPTLESAYQKKGIVLLEPEIVALCKEKPWTLPIPEVHSESGVIQPKADDNDRKYYGSNPKDGLPLVLSALYNTDSFEMLVATLVEAGGDADSNASVAGQLGGAIYGFDAIPWRWIEPVHRQMLSPRILGEDKTPRDKSRVNDLINSTLEMLMPEAKMLRQKQAECIRYATFSQDSRFVYLKFPADQQKAVEKYISVCNIPPCAMGIGDLWFPQVETLTDKIMLRMDKAPYEALVKTAPEQYPPLSKIERETGIIKTYPEIEVSKLVLPKAVNKKHKDDGQTQERLCFLEMHSRADARLFSSFYDIQYTGSYSFPGIGRMGRCDDRMIAAPLQLSSGKTLIPLTMDKYCQLLKNFPALQRVLPEIHRITAVLEKEYGEIVEQIREIFQSARKMDLLKVPLPPYSPEFSGLPKPVLLETAIANPTEKKETQTDISQKSIQIPGNTKKQLPAPKKGFFAQRVLPQPQEQQTYPVEIIWVPNKSVRMAKTGKMAVLCGFNNKQDANEFSKQWETAGAFPPIILSKEGTYQVVLTEDHLKAFLAVEDARKVTAFKLCENKPELPELITWSEISGMATCEFGSRVAAMAFADIFNTGTQGKIVMLSRENIEATKLGNLHEEWMAMQVLNFHGKRGPLFEIGLQPGGMEAFIYQFPNKEAALAYASFWNKEENDIQSDCSFVVSKLDMENLVRNGTPEQRARAEKVLEQALLDPYDIMMDADCLENLKKFNSGAGH